MSKSTKSGKITTKVAKSVVTAPAAMSADDIQAAINAGVAAALAANQKPKAVKEPKAAKAPKETKAPKEAKADKEPLVRIDAVPGAAVARTASRDGDENSPVTIARFNADQRALNECVELCAALGKGFSVKHTSEVPNGKAGGTRYVICQGKAPLADRPAGWAPEIRKTLKAMVAAKGK